MYNNVRRLVYEENLKQKREEASHVQLLLILLKFWSPSPHQSRNPRTFITVFPETRSLSLLLTLGARSFVLGPVPCPAGHLAAALGSTHQIPVAPQPPHTPAVTTSSDSVIARYSLGGELPPVKNHQSEVSA